jgi:hypothetical protein
MEDRNEPDVLLPVDQERVQRQRCRVWSLPCHTNPGCLKFCRENNISNVQDWSPALEQTLRQAFQALAC